MPRNYALFLYLSEITTSRQQIKAGSNTEGEISSFQCSVFSRVAPKAVRIDFLP
jgi:hypothetical protein